MTTDFTNAVCIIVHVLYIGSPSFVFTPVVISTWSSTPDICIEDYSLDGDEGGGADDEDNIAYKKIVVSNFCLRN